MKVFELKREKKIGSLRGLIFAAVGLALFIPFVVTAAVSDGHVITNSAPYKPVGLTSLGYRVLSTNPQICWSGGDPEGDTVTFHVYLGTSAHPTSDIWSGTASCTTQLGTLNDGVHYYWRVRGYDGALWGDYSDDADFATNDPPSAPTVMIPNTAVQWRGGISYYVDWLDSHNSDYPSSDAIAYTALYSSDGGSNWTQLVIGTSLSYYYWTTPSINTNQALIKVIAWDGYEITVDQSDIQFTIDSTNPASNCFCDSFSNSSPIPVGFVAGDGFGTLNQICLWYRFAQGAWTLWPTCGTGTTGTIFFSPPLGEGHYQFYTIASDLAGNQQQTPTSPFDEITFDTTNPTSNCTSPAATNADHINVGFTSYDGLSGIARVELWYKYGAGSWTNSGVSSTESSGTFTFWPPFGDGAYSFYSIALDNASNRENAPFQGDSTTVFDRVRPISLITPTPPPYTNQSQIQINFTASDVNGSGIANTSLWYKSGSGNWNDSGLPPVSGSSGLFSFSFGSGQGLYYFYTLSHDNAGNDELPASGSGKATVFLDTEAPESSVSGPAYTSVNPIQLPWTAGDNLSGPSSTRLWVKYLQAGVWMPSVLEAQSGSNGTFLYTALNEGQYYFATVCTDIAGNVEPNPTGNGDTSCVYDAVLPISSATSAHYATAAPISVSFTASDAVSGIDFVTLWVKFGSGTWQSSGLSIHQSSGAFDFTPSDQGTFYFASVATDHAGNSEALPTGVGDCSTIFDSVPPASTASAPQYLNSGVINVSWQASDATSGVSGTSLWVSYQAGVWANSGLPPQAGATGTFHYSAAQGDGAYCFATVATDNAGNLEAAPSGSGDSCTIYDTHVPSATMDDLPAVVYRDIYTMTYSYQDDAPSSGLNHVSIFYRKDAGSWTLYGTDTPVDGQFDFNFVQAGGEGFYEFEVTAADNAGNEELRQNLAEAFTQKEPSRQVNLNVSPASGNLHPGAVITITVALQASLLTQVTSFDAYFYYDPVIFAVPVLTDETATQDSGASWDESNVDAFWDSDGQDMDHVQYHKSGASGIAVQNLRVIYTLQLQVKCSAPPTGSTTFGIFTDHAYVRTIQGEDVTGVLGACAFGLGPNHVPSDPVLTQSAGQWAGWVNSPPQLQATSADPDLDQFRADFFVDESAVVRSSLTPSGSSATYTPAGLDEGDHRWRAFTEDHCLQSQTTSANNGDVAFRLDMTDPGLPANVQTAPDDWSRENDFIVSWENPIDLSGIGAAFYKFDDPPLNDADGNRVAGSGISSLDLSVPIEGNHPVYLWLEDAAGNKNYHDAASVALKFDATDPSIAFINVYEGFCVNSLSFVIEGTAGDLGSGLASVEIKINGGAWTPVDGLDHWTYAHGFTSQGAYAVQARAADVSGLTSTTAVVHVSVDATVPSSHITSPTDGSATNAPSVTVSGTAVDAGGFLSSVMLSTDGGATFFSVTGLESWHYDLQSVPEGTYHLVSKALDCAGNTETPGAGVALVVDRTAPHASISYPTPAAVIAGREIVIRGAASDDRAGVATVEVSTDDGVNWNQAQGGAQWTYTWQVPQDGTYDLACRAVDAAGNRSTPDAPIMVTIDNEPPFVALAGYWNTSLSGASGGNLILLAYIPSVDVLTVELYADYQPTGVLLTDDGQNGDWAAGDHIFSFAAAAPPGLPAGDYLVQIVATDQAGNAAEWPHLRVYDQSEAAANLPPQVTAAAWQAMRRQALEGLLEPWIGAPRDLLPMIFVAGYWQSMITEQNGGQLDLWAYVPDPDAAQITSAEIYFSGQPTGLLVPNQGGGLFQLSIPLPGGVPAGDYLLELRATDSIGRTSTLWPYLTIR